MLRPFLFATAFFSGLGLLQGQAGSPTTQPLIQQSDVRYLGSFRLPTHDDQGNRLTYGGKGLGHNPTRNSLFLQCHDHDGGLTEVSIPSFGAEASILQPCTDVFEGATVDQDVNGTHISGNLVYKGRLITTEIAWYDADNTQGLTHGVSASLDFANEDNFLGFFAFHSEVAAPPRALAGYMGFVPTEWQGLLGGPAITGQAAVSIIGSSSDGPALTVFDPATLGAMDSLEGTTVLYYPSPQSHPDFGANGSQVAGVAFPTGTRSVLFWGTRALNPYCYGSPQDCPYSCSTHQGPHNQYKHTIWAYDANDFLDVMAGSKAPWELQHYARWEWDDIHPDSC
ncbi:MAG: hypothetical protein KTR24_13770, partial [Saprospiraceae bacterium]|nr:hypothetical protein [Saprospiraceae bacterium]